MQFLIHTQYMISCYTDASFKLLARSATTLLAQWKEWKSCSSSVSSSTSGGEINNITKIISIIIINIILTILSPLIYILKVFFRRQKFLRLFFREFFRAQFEYGGNNRVEFDGDCSRQLIMIAKSAEFMANRFVCTEI